MFVELADYIGYKGILLSEDRTILLGSDGFFDVTLKPRQGTKFKDNMVCILSLNPNAVPQDPSVLKIIGKKGENPLARIPALH